MDDTITYVFKIEAGADVSFEVNLNRPAQSGDLPDWTLLENNKCANCPLAAAPGARCPAAADLVPIVQRFSELASIGNTMVRVVRPQFELHKQTDTQTALSALMGLILATSGCPILNRMRPMAQMHLPFPSENEVVYRIVSMHLFKCYLDGTTPDLKDLETFFADVDQLNHAFAKRIKRATQEDASINALVLLHSRSMLASLSIEDNLAQIRAWFPVGSSKQA